MDAAKIAAWDLMYGIHSDIPLCCVMEYTYAGEEFVTKRNEERVKENSQLHDPYGFHIGYVPCSACYKEILEGGEPVPVHHCTPVSKLCQAFNLQFVMWFGRTLPGFIHSCQHQEGGENTEEMGASESARSSRRRR